MVVVVMVMMMVITMNDYYGVLVMVKVVEMVMLW